MSATDDEGFIFLDAWRRDNHFVHGNAFALTYVLTPQWRSLTGQMIVIGLGAVSAQRAVLDLTLRPRRDFNVVSCA